MNDEIEVGINILSNCKGHKKTTVFGESLYVEFEFESWVCEKLKSGQYSLRHNSSRSRHKLHFHKQNIGGLMYGVSLMKAVKEIIRHYEHIEKVRNMSNLEAKGLFDKIHQERGNLLSL